MAAVLPLRNEPANVAMTSAGQGDLERFTLYAQRLWAEAQDHVNWRRGVVEPRWLEDIAQYNGVAQSSELYRERQLQRGRRSTVRLNWTQRYCNLAESRIGDILFPADGSLNWGYEATPEPRLSVVADDNTPVAEVIGDDLAGMLEDGDRSVGGITHEMISEASRKAGNMQRKVADNLAECRYETQSRKVIHDAVIYGTGVIRGPVTSAKPNREFVPVPDGDPGERMLKVSQNTKPAAEWLDIWGFYPDMSALSIEDARYVFYLTLATKERVAALKFLEGAVPWAIDRVLALGPRQFMANDDLRETMRGWSYSASMSRGESRYPLFSYTGPADLDDIGVMIPREAVPPVPPEIGLKFEIWFIGPYIVRVNPAPLETGDLGYSVFNWSRDPASIWGYGIPWAVRDTQRMATGAFRSIANNTGVTSMPQILVRQGYIEPADKEPNISAGKVWYANQKAAGMSMRDLFDIVDIPNNADQFLAIIDHCRDFMMEEAMQPPIAQGEGPVKTQTAQGTSLISYNANANIRRLVREWDDSITLTLLPRFHDWHMLKSDDPDIKGDMKTVALGVEVLLQRELQAQNLMTFAAMFSESPEFAPMLDLEKILRKIVQAHNLRYEDIAKSESQIAEDARLEAEEAAANPEPPDPQMVKIQGDQALKKQQLDQNQLQAQMRTETQLQELQMQLQIEIIRQQTEFAKIAADQGTSVEEVLQAARAATESNKTKLAVETLKQRGQNARDRMEIAVEQPDPRLS